MTLITDTGFGADDWTHGWGDTGPGRDLAATADPQALDLTGVQAIRVAFAAFTDGRGFSVAQALRARGFTGRLRAVGQLIPDQYPMARRAGFDEVEIDPTRASRQSEAQWLAQTDWRRDSYRTRLGYRGGSAGN